MARPIWNGTISFGLLNIPVQLYSGVRSVDLHFRMLDARNRKPIRYERVNADTGEEVPWKDVVKAYEYAKGNYVVVKEAELRKLAPEATESVDIETFVDATQIDPMYFEKPYFLVPGKKAEKGYVLLREALKKTGKAAVARVVIRTRQYLALLFAHGRALVLNLMRFEQELVAEKDFALPAGALAKYRITAHELKMAQDLLESMTSDWQPSRYKDEFRDKLRRMLKTRVDKRKGTLKIDEHSEEAAAPASDNVVDFMALLKQSLDKKAAKPARAKGASRRTRDSRNDDDASASKKAAPRKTASRRHRRARTTTRRRAG